MCAIIHSTQQLHPQAKSSQSLFFVVPNLTDSHHHQQGNMHLDITHNHQHKVQLEINTQLQWCEHISTAASLESPFIRRPTTNPPGVRRGYRAMALATSSGLRIVMLWKVLYVGTLVCQFADCHVVTSVVRWFATLRIVILEPVLSVGWFASGGAFQILWLMLALWRWVRESFQTSRVCSYYARTLKSIGSKSECALSTVGGKSKRVFFTVGRKSECALSIFGGKSSRS